MPTTDPAIHPGVTDICPVTQKRTFTTVEAFQENLAKVTEAWLRDDQWVPMFFYASLGPGRPIVGGFLPDFTTSDELLAIMRPEIRKEGWNVVAFLIPARSRFPGVTPPPLPNIFCLHVFDRTGLKSFVRSWNIKIDESGKVLSWSPCEGESQAVFFSAERVFQIMRE